MSRTFDTTVAAITASPRKLAVVGALCKEAGIADVLKKVLQSTITQRAGIGGGLGALTGAATEAYGAHRQGQDPWEAARRGAVGGAGVGAVTGGLHGSGAIGKRMAEMGALGGGVGALGGGIAGYAQQDDPWERARHGAAGGAGIGAVSGGMLGANNFLSTATPAQLHELFPFKNIPDETLKKGLSAALATAGVATGGGIASALTGGDNDDAVQEQADKEMGRFQGLQKIKEQQRMELAPLHAQAFAVAQADDVISQADPALVSSSFDTMKRFAPSLAADPNAVRSFIRESATWGTGPSYATLKNLADAERAVTGAGGAVL